MIPLVRCWLKHVVKYAARIKHRPRHRHGIGRHGHSAGAAKIATATKHAAIWKCAVIGSIGGLGVGAPGEIGSGTLPGGFAAAAPVPFGPIAHYYPPEAFGETPPEFETTALIPPLFFVPAVLPPAQFAPVPDVPTVLPLPPLPPETTPLLPEQPKPVPEPGSLALLGTALAALIAWRFA